MNKEMNVRSNLFGIMPNVTVELVQKGLFAPVVSRKSINACGLHTDSTNGYFRLKGTNLVWMHVQDGYGIFINQYVQTGSGELVNLVEILSQHYWYIENRTGTIKCFTLDCRALYRCIESIIIYGNINRKLPKWLEVHHKWWKWCNTQNAMTAVCYQKHQYFHNAINSRRSHKRGVVIRNVKNFMYWEKVIAAEDVNLKNRPM